MCAVWHLASSAQPLTIPIVPVHAASLTRRKVQTHSWVIPSLGSVVISRPRRDCLSWASEPPQASVLSRASATVPYDSAVPTPLASGTRVLRHYADSLGMTANGWTVQKVLVETSMKHPTVGVMRAQVALIVAFSSSALLGLAYRIFLFTIPHRFSMGLRSGEFAGQLRTGIPWSLNQVLVALALCAGAKSCWKMKSASP